MADQTSGPDQTGQHAADQTAAGHRTAPLPDQTIPARTSQTGPRPAPVGVPAAADQPGRPDQTTEAPMTTYLVAYWSYFPASGDRPPYTENGVEQGVARVLSTGTTQPSERDCCEQIPGFMHGELLGWLEVSR